LTPGQSIVKSPTSTQSYIPLG